MHSKTRNTIVLWSSMVFVFVLSFSCGSIDFRSLQTHVHSSSEIALPSIVQLDVKITKTDLSPADGMRPFLDYFFDDPSEKDKKRTFRFESLGSGVVFLKKNDLYFIITNGHVVGEAEEVSILLYDGQEFQGKVVGKDPRKDIAVISFTSSVSIPLASFANSDKVRIGDFVLAIGSPYGFQSSVTFGIVSALNRRGGPSDNVSDFIQTDAAINQGNSGGALVNMNGEVVGINTWISSQTGDSVGLGFAIPINSVKNSALDLIEFGRIRYGWIGVHFQTIDQSIKKNLRNQVNRGVLLTGLYQDSPGAQAGLRLGDVIVSVNEKQIKEMGDLIQSVGESSVESKLLVQVIRDGKPLSVYVKVEERRADDDLASKNRLLFPGFVAYPLNNELREELKASSDQEGYLVTQVVPGSVAQLAGLKAKDIVVSIDGKLAVKLTEFYVMFSDPTIESFEIVVLREGEKVDLLLKRADRD